jgi:lipoprotein-anchoring transpeptidase ErfK/SrfK
MPPRSLLRTIVFAGLVTTALLTTQSARAQGLIDFLWGGGQEWGGSRQVITFDQQYSPNQIIVSFGDRRLYFLTKRGQAISYPIAVPREQSRWQGTTAVSSKKENPSWRPTPDMIKENPKLPTWVPGGHPMNPLGVRAMYLGASTYRIHGTDAPWTIGQAVSKGCIRMTNEDVLDLYPRVPVGMKVTVTWQRFSTDGSSAAASSEEPSYNTAAQNVSDEHPSAESRRNTIRNLAPLPRRASDEGEGTGAAVPDDFVAVDENGNAVPAKKAAKAKAKMDAVSDKGAEPKSEKKKDVVKSSDSEKAAEAKPAKHDARPTETAKIAEPVKAAEPVKTEAIKAAEADKTTANAVETARRAADAAAKAAQVAREAAEAAKKAAADAKKATSASGTGQEPDKSTVKSAAAAL